MLWSFLFYHADADEILVLEQGEITERGNHEELLSKNGKYSEMWSKQDEETTFTSDTIKNENGSNRKVVTSPSDQLSASLTKDMFGNIDDENEMKQKLFKMDGAKGDATNNNVNVYIDANVTKAQLQPLQRFTTRRRQNAVVRWTQLLSW